MLLLLTSCQEVDPRAVYTQAQKKTAALSQGEQKIDLSFVLDPEGEAITYQWEMTARFVQKEKGIELEVQSDNHFPKRDFTSGSIYQNGIFYVNDNGKKYQAEMEYSVLDQRISRIYPDITLSVSQLDEIQSSKKENGMLFRFSVAADEVQILTDFAISQMQNFANYVPTDVKPQKGTGEILVSGDSYIQTTSLNIPCVIVNGDETIDAVLTYQNELVSPGSSIQIKVEDPESYPAVSIWDLPW